MPGSCESGKGTGLRLQKPEQGDKAQVDEQPFAKSHQVHEDCSWHVSAAGRLVEVHVGALELQVGLAGVGAGGVDAVLIAHDLWMGMFRGQGGAGTGDRGGAHATSTGESGTAAYLPELGADLVTALASLLSVRTRVRHERAQGMHRTAAGTSLVCVLTCMLTISPARRKRGIEISRG